MNKSNDARLDPSPGDYWEDHLAPAAVVLAVTPQTVVVCRERKDVSPNRWTWDLSKSETMTRGQFARWLEYDTMLGTWATVHREAHESFAREYAAMQPNNQIQRAR